MKYITRIEFENRLDKTDEKIDSLTNKIDNHLSHTRNSLHQLRNDLNVIKDPLIEVENGNKLVMPQSELLKTMYKGLYPFMMLSFILSWFSKHKFALLLLLSIIFFALGFVTIEDFRELIIGK